MFFTHCYRALARLLSFVLHQVARWAWAFVRFVKCMLCQLVIQDRVMMLYPSGCLNPITLHICLIMFTGRLDTMHCHSRVSVLMRADLTALPLVIQPPCDRLRYPVTCRLCESYFLSDIAIKMVHNAVRANASQTVRLINLASN